MTEANREKRRYLERYLASEAKIEDTEREIRRHREMGEKITSVISSDPRSGGVSDRVGEAASMITDAANRLLGETQTMLRTCEEVKAYINLAPKETYRRVLRLRYIGGMSMLQIAWRMSYTESWINQLHGLALASLPAPPKTTKENEKSIV